jgi:glucose/arabinose dehydrogenase
MMFYTGNLFPEWKGHLFVGAMPSQYLSHMVVNGERIMSEEKLLTDLKQRIRDVRQGPDGSIYVLAGNSLLRLTPKR